MSRRLAMAEGAGPVRARHRAHSAKGATAKFRAFLQARPERHIAYVGHWAVLYALTGIDFDNCELVSTNLDALAEPEELDPDFL